MVDEWKAGEDELLKSAARVHSQARERGAEITYDSIGVGAFAGAKFDELNESTGIESAPQVQRRRRGAQA
jgi:phage terminase large subunit